MIIPVPERKDLPAAAEIIAPIVRQAQIVAFHGDMGAGKTTLIKALCDIFGVRDTVVSPTFALVNEYHDSAGHPIFHFDFYRINSPNEAYDLGYEEYFYSPFLCLIEWPEKIIPLLPPHALRLYIEVGKGEQRIIRLDIKRETFPVGEYYQ
ncbi:MAG: tRNA (adenosine(37)-N6)-threonylcarbamoyltransferase complex ATPase subunit type 1 TsaE [Prevotellaceae bacterium]|jgi:tRNA threonylcarbamoyladenosine biosynthesis protein TsaE|nr:tRNA (adenosine(37)-N6)-threonylcarbamoyltransferase complex ATPase subunit type 1 TsaE [Prevotellaceae bacterium]